MATAFTPQYITPADVFPIVSGKMNTVFDDPLQVIYLNNQCAWGEADVQKDLSRLYLIPLQASDGTFDSLPMMTRAYIFQLFIYRTALRLLSVDFGDNSSVIADDYSRNIFHTHRAQIDQCYTYDSRSGLFKFFPLPGLMVNKAAVACVTVAKYPIVMNPVPPNLDNMRTAVNRMTTTNTTWLYPQGDLVVVPDGTRCV